MYPGKLRAAVSASTPVHDIADDRDQVARTQHMPARIAVRSAAQNGLAVYETPRHAVQKATHARAQYCGHRRTVSRQKRIIEIQHALSFLWFGVRPQPIGLTRNPVDKVIEDVC